eukprot:CAMPEP_0180490236 /NCGR_PEP_ID=MMETSP1036_2-20121128/39010_1 /TAXON_ID=632150 /ORGANISM="Azadinium spinosum, Strain 3D9" /LENGTH=173 /DNA_ID=CAMNT_0022498421 /DNA_START=22 /DNA_END=540 /DNA_ORIENTATION=+
MAQSKATLRVRIEPGIPKLLVKINPAEAEAFNAKNLGEVTIRKATGHRNQVAVLHMSRSVNLGEILMSLKMADLLDINDDEHVEVTSAPAGDAPVLGSRRPQAPPPASDVPPASQAASTASRGLGYSGSDWLRELERERERVIASGARGGSGTTPLSTSLDYPPRSWASAGLA